MREQVNTTPDALHIAESLAQMVENHCHYAVLETSSQGLWKKRLAGIFFDFGVYLNLSHDHIGAGEHTDMQEYLRAKSMLLRQCMIGIVNRGDEHCGEILRHASCRELFFFEGITEEAAQGELLSAQLKQERALQNRSIEGSMCRDHMQNVLYAGGCRNYRNGSELGTTFCVNDMGHQQYTIPLPGSFNVENAMAAITVCRQLGITPAVTAQGLRRVRVPGRMENVSFRTNVGVYIDYAHNEASLGNVLQMLRGYEPGRLICVFGCGGNRAVCRRTEMGKTSGMLADMSVITSDNPRWEEPEAIIADIVNGIRPTGGRYLCITDRREAIAYTLSITLPGDMILIAGKGHESYQEIRGVRHRMSDREIVQEYARTSGQKQI